MSRIVLEKDPVLVGLIANTHGTVASAAVNALRGCDLIVHAGDIGSEAALDTLREVAPVVAIRGNSDRQQPLCALPEALEIITHDAVILVVHNHALREWPPAEGVRAVVSGLWHQPSVLERDGVLLISPGSAAEHLWAPASVAMLAVHASRMDPSIVTLEASARGHDGCNPPSSLQGED